MSGIAADSLGAKRVGSLMFPLAQKFVDQSVLVSDEAILAAKSALWDTLRISRSPAVPLRWPPFSPAPIVRTRREVGVLLCGANTSVSFA